MPPRQSPTLLDFTTIYEFAEPLLQYKLAVCLALCFFSGLYRIIY
ncbi:hypothetical protein FMEAI12_7010002 [Parafrankia sp. Ea1.12]|nr:hypothetical protein FMEAI12_7010002 [Parafrankia sp. Ea1.12]